MKAIVYTEYGSPEVLQLVERPKPNPKPNEVLIKLHATSLNASDAEFLMGKPAYVRMFALFKPHKQVLGSDIAGIVEAVGTNVAEFKVGDAVFGDVFGQFGGLAEYICVAAQYLAHKPDNIDFLQAAAMPQAAVVALQTLRDEGKIRAGQHVLINGAGGGSGSFAIQLAKQFGAKVTAVDSAEKLDDMRQWGADLVIDYRLQDFASNGQTYDLIVDLVATRSMLKFKRALTPNGRYVMAGGTIKSIFSMLIIGSLLSLIGTQKFKLLMHKRNRKDLEFMLELMQSGEVSSVIDRVYPLVETEQAFKRLCQGHGLGKLVISMADGAD